MTCLQAKLIGPLGHGQFAVVKLCFGLEFILYSSHHLVFEVASQSDIHTSTKPNTANHRISESTVAAESEVRHGTGHR
jgi:hypothetical protein